MSHDRPIPEAAQSPFPAHPAPHPVPQAATPAPAAETKANDDGRTRRVITGAAVGIGSAAVVAALLYVNRKPAKPVPVPPPPRVGAED